MTASTSPAPSRVRGAERPSLAALNKAPLADYYVVVFAVGILCALGSMMVLSASSVLAQSRGESPYYYSIRQLVFLVVGVVAAVVLSRMSTEALRRLGWVAWSLAVVLLVLVLTPLGHGVNGNTNWLRIGPVQFQPSEFAKLALVVWGAALFHAKRRRLHETNQLLVPFVPGALVVLALVLAGRDLGTGVVIALLIMALLFFVGTSLRLLVPAGLAAIAVVVFLVFGSSNRMSRIQVFLDPQWNTDLSSQPMSALYALASGGWWGLGLGASKQKWGGLKDAAHTDFIFAVIGEELGLFGVLVVVAMFALLARAGFSIALQSDKMFNRLAAAGVTAWLLTQALINILVVVHLLPVLGIPLPFISSGGSALMANLMAIGVLLAVARDTPAARRHLGRSRRTSQPRMTSVVAAGGGS